MFFFGDFCEVPRDEAAAPWIWRWPNGANALVRFLVRSARAPQSGLVRVRFYPGRPGSSWLVVEARADPVRLSGLGGQYTAFQALITPPDDESACIYELGFRRADGASEWSGRRRPMTFSRAPTRLANIPETLLDVQDGGPVFGPSPQVPITAGPGDWRSRTAYSVIVDRFAKGMPDRQGLGLVPYDPASPHASHGGNFQALREKLPYIRDLGVGTLMLSPVYTNGAEGYHGYHPVDLLAVDPRLGRLDDLQELIAAAHDLGLAVTLDMLVNHIAPSIVWRRDGDGDGYTGAFRYDEGAVDCVPILPIELRHARYFHGPEDDGDEERGRLFGFLEDWRTEDPPVRDALVKHLKYWLSVTDVDGFRYDAVRHVDRAFWEHCIGDVARYARAIGKTGFLQIGEHSSPEPAVQGEISKAAGFDGMVDYPLYYAIRDHFRSGKNDTSTIAARLDRDCFLYRDSRLNLAFLDNHDVDRALAGWPDRWGDLATARSASHAALALLFFGPEIPALYYGIEQEFEGRLVGWTAADGRTITDDAYVREDMFENQGCAWRHGPLNAPRHPPYDRTNPTYRAIRDMAGLRRREPALNAGDRVPLNDGKGGLLVHAMVTGEEILVCAVNLTHGQKNKKATFAPEQLAAVLGKDGAKAATPRGAEVLYRVNRAAARWEASGLALDCPSLSAVLCRLLVS